tara:strand:- start:169 stop:939 length:771 start_codon:yes stop_codon:yes gene_type:complete
MLIDHDYILSMNLFLTKIKNKLRLFFSKIKANLTSTKFIVKYSEVTVKNHKYFLLLNALHNDDSYNFLMGNYYEPTTHDYIKKLIMKKPGNIIHAGTSFGDMIPSFSQIIGKEYILYAFEPNLENYILCKKTIEENHINNTILFNVALSSKIGFAKLQTIDEKNIPLGGRSIICENGNKIVNTIKIDNLDIDNLSCIHLDIEGHELLALKGAENTIKKNLPVIYIEDNKSNCSNYLNSIGYIKTNEIPNLDIWEYK